MATPHFTDAELGCHHCGRLPSQNFQDKLEQFRREYGHPLRLSSAFRCSEHNQAVSTTGPNGPHTHGAVDVLCYGTEAWDLLKAALKYEWTGIGVNQKGPREKRFIHLDDLPNSPDHPRPWVWSY